MYRSSHNHGSVKHGCISNSNYLSNKPIFHRTMICGKRVDDVYLYIHTWLQVYTNHLKHKYHIGVSLNWWYPKMDGENNGKPYEQMDFFLGGKPHYFLERSISTPTWRIIPVSNWLVTPIYKPFSPFGRGISLQNGMILQVHPYRKHWNEVDQLQDHSICLPHQEGISWYQVLSGDWPLIRALKTT